jgi:hypothetical protein
MKALLALPVGIDPEGNAGAHILRFDADADRVMAQFEGELEPRLGPHGDLGWMNDWAGKLPGHLARLSGLLHVADAPELKAPWEIPVSCACVERAVTLGRYLIPHAQAAYGAMGAEEDTAAADHLIGWIKRTQPKTFTRRDAHQANRGRFKLAVELDKPLGLLEEHRYVRRAASESEEPHAGRKPSQVFEVNPLAFDRAVPSHSAQNTHNHPQDTQSEESEHCEGSSLGGKRECVAKPASRLGGGEAAAGA